MKKGEVLETIFHHKNIRIQSNELGLLFGNNERLYLILQNNTKIEPTLFSKLETLSHSHNSHKLNIITSEPLSSNILELLENNTPQNIQNIEILPKSYVAHEFGNALLDYLMKPEEGPIKIDGSTTKQVNEVFIKPSLTLDEAKRISSKLGSVVNAELRLIPYYIIDYSTTIFDEDGQSSETISGTVRVDGITGDCSELSGEIKTAQNIDWTHHKFEPKFDSTVAIQKAKSAIIENKSRIIVREQDLGSAKVFEKKRLAPNDKDLFYNYRGIVYWPIWYFECSQGIIILDSTSSSIIHEEHFKHY